jgi:hypothetical protein
VLTFSIVTYIVAWSSWLAAGMTRAAGPRGLLFLLGTFAPGFVALWLTGRATGRSGVAALLRGDWHAAVNNTKDILPSAEPNATNPWALSHSPVAWLTVAVLSLCAGYFLLRMRKIPQLAREVEQRSADSSGSA